MDSWDGEGWELVSSATRGWLLPTCGFAALEQVQSPGSRWGQGWLGDLPGDGWSNSLELMDQYWQEYEYRRCGVNLLQTSWLGRGRWGHIRTTGKNLTFSSLVVHGGLKSPSELQEGQHSRTKQHRRFLECIDDNFRMWSRSQLREMVCWTSFLQTRRHAWRTKLFLAKLNVRRMYARGGIRDRWLGSVNEWTCRDEVRKGRPCGVEFGNGQEGHCSKKKTGGNLGSLLNGPGDLVTKDIEKDLKLLSPCFAWAFTVKICLQLRYAVETRRITES